jgi:hypothetical protein
MVYALHNFRRYLFGSHFNMYIDHSAIKYLVNKPMLVGGGGVGNMQVVTDVSRI